MMGHRLVFLGPFLAVVAAGPEGIRAEEARAPAEPADSDRVLPVFYLKDGSRVAGMPRFERLGIRTRYGLLEVPRGDLVQVRFAPREEPGEMERLRKAVGELGSDDFDAREEAMKVLREAGRPARRILLEAARSRDEEVKNRASVLLGETAPGKADAGGEEDLEPLIDEEDDEVITRRFTVRGEVIVDAIAVESSYGRLELPRDEIRGVVFVPESSVARSLAVPASNTAPEKWLDTKVSVARGLRLTIRAKGTLSVPNYNVTVGPEGTRQYSGTTFGSFPMLALIGKVGKNGKPFLVGPDYQGKASREGNLHLAVVPFRRNYAAMGSFQVRIEAKP
jgi:hypothetical protein